MKIIAQLMDVEAMSITETTNILELKDREPKIQIETLRDWSSLKATGNEAISNITEVDVDSAIGFEGLDIVRVSWIANSMCVYFASPADIAIVDEEKTIDVPFDPLETPMRCITVTDLNNVQSQLSEDNYYVKVVEGKWFVAEEWRSTRGKPQKDEYEVVIHQDGQSITMKIEDVPTRVSGKLEGNIARMGSYSYPDKEWKCPATTKVSDFVVEFSEDGKSGYFRDTWLWETDDGKDSQRGKTEGTYSWVSPVQPLKKIVNIESKKRRFRFHPHRR